MIVETQKKVINNTTLYSNTISKYTKESLSNNATFLLSNELTNETIYKNLGQKRKYILKNIYPFLKKLQKIAPNDILKYFPIVSTSETFKVLDRNISQKTVSKYIKILLDNNILYLTDNEYRFLSETSENVSDNGTYSRNYQINKTKLNSFISFIEDSKIVAKITNKKIYVEKEIPLTKKELKHTKRVFTDKELTFNSKKNIILNEKLNRTVEQYIKELNIKYNMSYYNNMAYNININLTHEQEQIIFKPNVTLNKSKTRITKVGIRATNSICNLKSTKNYPDYTGFSREDYLTERLGSDYCEFDIKSSVPRVNYFLNFGVWLDNDIDLYTLMNGKEWEYENERNDFKSIFMRLYFSSSYKQCTHKILRIWKRFWKEDKTLTPKEREMCIALYNLVINKDRIDVIILEKNEIETKIKEYIKEKWLNVRKVIGKTIDSEVFFYESAFYLEIMNELTKKGLEVIQIYDGFYFKKKNKDEIENEIYTFLQVLLYKNNKGKIKENRIGIKEKRIEYIISVVNRYLVDRVYGVHLPMT